MPRGVYDNRKRFKRQPTKFDVAMNKKSKTSEEFKICAQCQEKFFLRGRFPQRFLTQRFCSRRCAAASKKGTIRAPIK